MKSSVKHLLLLLVVLIFFSHCSSGRTLNQLLEKSGQGNVAAQVQLAGRYNERQDYAEALKWYQKAADKGCSGAQVKALDSPCLLGFVVRDSKPIFS